VDPLDEARVRWYSSPARLIDDIREHSRAAVGDYATRVDLAGLSSSPRGIAVLAALHTLESATLSRLRLVLLTPTHTDAQVTAFLATWAYERHWIANALAAALDTLGGETIEPVPGTWWQRFEDRLRPTAAAVWTNVVGEPVVATHLVEASLEEWLMIAAYRRLAAAEPGLAELCRAIVATKQVHQRYFATRAARDLGGSPQARRLARRRLCRWSWPQRGSRPPMVALDPLLDLLTTPAGRPVREVEQRLRDLPGLAAVGLVRHRQQIETIARGTRGRR